jgi:hypothetical protein
MRIERVLITERDDLKGQKGIIKGIHAHKGEIYFRVQLIDSKWEVFLKEDEFQYV